LKGNPIGSIIFLLYNQFDDNSSIHGEHSEDNIIDDNEHFKLKNYNNNENEIIFNIYSYSYCICIIRIVDYRQNIDKLKNPVELRRYYSLFFNTMASIIKHHEGKVIKNIEDGLLFYFPHTVNFSKMSTFQNVLDCGLAMINANSTLNSSLGKNGLPSTGYKISANYGRVELATSTNSNNVDLFGPAVNICSKINHLALPNQMVIYKDLYDVIEKTSFFKDYVFKNLIENKINNQQGKCQYPVYSIDSIDDKRIQNIIYNKKIQGQIKQRQNLLNSPNSAFNILLIDDDDDVLFTFEFIVKNEGYNVVSYSNSNKALAHISELDPYYYDLVVTDIRMPGFNGFQLYKQIKVLNADTKALFLSALDVAEEIMIVCPGTNASDIIRKPIDSGSLLCKIKSLLRS
jgi:two-component system, OmpR family, response regulator ChvI